jgi:amidohydrolase
LITPIDYFPNHGSTIDPGAATAYPNRREFVIEASYQARGGTSTSGRPRTDEIARFCRGSLALLRRRGKLTLSFASGPSIMIVRIACLTALGLFGVTTLRAQDITDSRIEELAAAVEPKVIGWRRDIHANPELGNREFRTSALIARHLERLGLEVTTGIAHTGVVGILRGARPGRVIGLRADMDALPVTEQVELPFASNVTTVYNGQEVGVMHACGHDTHVAMLMGVAEVLASLRGDLAGTVMFIFQPAEEGAPDGEEGGAELMLAEGLFDIARPDAVFALHVVSDLPSGAIGFRAGPALASADTFEITVNGSQTHGAMPWNGVDPIVTAAQIVTATQTIISRQVNISELPAVVSFGTISGGVRTNIIPESVTLSGTIRTYDLETKSAIHERLTRTATAIAESAGATADVEISIGYPPTINDSGLVARTRETLDSAFGSGTVLEVPRGTAAEDFSYFANEVPGLMMVLGVRPPDVGPGDAAPNHSPRFFVDEAALVTGVQALLTVTTSFLSD